MQIAFALLHTLRKYQEEEEEYCSFIRPPTLRFRVQIFQVCWVPMQPLKRAGHLSTVSTAADMYSFGFAFQLSGSIFGPLTTFLGEHFLPADLSGYPAPGLILPSS